MIVDAKVRIRDPTVDVWLDLPVVLSVTEALRAEDTSDIKVSWNKPLRKMDLTFVSQ